MAVLAPTRRHHSPIDRDYWLAHCEGYRVEGAAGAKLVYLDSSARPVATEPGG